MHRTLVRLLSPAIALLFSAAPAFSAEETTGLRLATFTCDVTPPLGGHPLIWVTPVAEVEARLLAKGVVLDDGVRRYVLCALDWCGLCNSSYELFRSKIAAAAGTEATQVAVHSVHQHTAPYTDGDAQRLLDELDKDDDLPLYVDFEFLDEVTDRLADSVRQSLGKLEPFDHVGVGQAKVDRVASTRRIPIEGGKVRSRMSSCKDPELRALTEGVIDPMVKTITFARGDKPLVRLHYYATHPQSFYGDPRASSDVPGFARERLEEKEGVFQIYFTGCSGDVAMGKYNDASRTARDELTDRLYAGLEAAVASTRLTPVEGLQWRTLALALPARTDPGYTVEENRARMKNPEGNVIRRIRAATRVAYAERSERPIDLSVLVIGDVHVLHLPGECMVEFQLFAQRSKPDAFVAVAAYGDLGPGYICTERAFPEGGYEPTASRVAPHSEALLKEAIQKLLEADASLAAEGEEGFVSIFNGKDLSGWEGEEGFWTVEDGAITGISTPEKPVRLATYLMWRGEKVADFELRFSYRIPAGNSGVQFRSRELENWDITGYQADFDAPNQWTGCLYDCNSHRADPNRVIAPQGQKVEIDAAGKRTPSAIADPAELLKHVKKDGWNEYHVVARGPLVTLKINGHVTSQVIDHEKGKAARSGILAIQLHGGEPMKVQVKNLRLKRFE